MIFRTSSDWRRLYRSIWRLPYADWPKKQRAKLVRGCKDKAVYESPEEALPIIAAMPLRAGLYLKVYKCLLCSLEDGRPAYHVGNSRCANTLPERAIRRDIHDQNRPEQL